jgi:diguanylate cyclase (GGDEF)-like protein
VTVGCLAVLLGFTLLTLPALTAAVIPTAVLLCWRTVQVARLERAATTDATTGLLNAHGLRHAYDWHDLAGAATGPRAGQKAGTSVLMIDVDHFKAINDRYGHPAGHVVLAAVAGVIAESVRDGDTAGRYGGDEFVVLLAGIGPAELEWVAERVRAAVAALRVEITTGDTRATVDGLSVSVGAVSCPAEAGISVDRLLHSADAALYTAKRNGRNIVCHEAIPLAATRLSRRL